jgi:hypothetical protein
MSLGNITGLLTRVGAAHGFVTGTGSGWQVLYVLCEPNLCKGRTKCKIVDTRVEEESLPKQNEIHHIQMLCKGNSLIKQTQDIFSSHAETVDMV